MWRVLRNDGFTLIELVMVILLLAILSAIAIPNFIDFRTDAKNAATYGALGALRSAVAISMASIQVKEDPTQTSPKYPTLMEMYQNQFDASHPNLSATAIMDPSVSMPSNPWTVSTATITLRNTVLDCLQTKSIILSGAGSIAQRGWCYRQTSGEIWANSDANNGGAGKTENAY
jgi:MSHA pilin protein MshA